eukprot:CAMPEP_0182427630 /NCGR_PEP_ID=MMETSP1167-20130531/18925_1 /TAXON_ID=2988 /ORGANISM="Mallomonas Sp, Strain CCMP3275" /LENGTH=498 /DNA_ID=CAMNT_0024610003 /DNA_START=325 /DNA_END=1821 /DNA_ORIENTATION=-
MKIISGEIPGDASGLFMRIGPNQIHGHYSRRYHLFDGHGMIHAVRLQKANDSEGAAESVAFYSNQYLNTPRYELEKKLDRPVFLLIGELKGMVGLVKALLVTPLILFVLKKTQLNTGQANTAIYSYQSRLFAGHEGSLPFEIYWDDEEKAMKSIGYETFGDRLNYPVTAHAKVDPVEGELFFLSYSPNDKQHPMKYGYMNASADMTAYYGIPIPVIPFAHDFAMTEHYILVIESSVHFTPEKLLQGEFFSFTSSHKFRIGVVLKASHSASEIQWFETDSPLCVVHTMHAWEQHTEDGLEIVLWTPIAPSFDGGLQERADFTMREVRLKMRSGEMSITTIDTRYQIEFPRVHPDYLGRPARYGFAHSFTGELSDVMYFNGIVKYDMQHKRVAGALFLADNYVFSGECIPIPKDRSGAVEEQGVGDYSDTVYLGAFVLNLITDSAEWHLYDGESMSSTPLVRLDVPARVPMGFHSDWMSEAKLQQHIAATKLSNDNMARY